MKILFFAVLFFSFRQIAPAQKNKQNDESAIRSARESSNMLIAKHDVDGFAKYWLPDFIIVRGNSMITTGKEANIISWKELFKTNPDVFYIRNPSEIIISDNDSLAWEKGTWIGIKSYSKGGSYSAMWKKKNGDWKLQAELFVSLY